jgi:hypothetical protein
MDEAVSGGKKKQPNASFVCTSTHWIGIYLASIYGTALTPKHHPMAIHMASNIISGIKQKESRTSYARNNEYMQVSPRLIGRDRSRTGETQNWACSSDIMKEVSGKQDG